MASTFIWVFEGEIPAGMSGDALLSLASQIREAHPELKLKLVKFDNYPTEGVINLPAKASYTDWDNSKQSWVR